MDVRVTFGFEIAQAMSERKIEEPKGYARQQSRKMHHKEGHFYISLGMINEK